MSIFFLLYSEMGVSLPSVGPPRTKSMVLGLSNKPNNSAIRQKLKSPAHFEILTKFTFLGCFGHFLPQNGEKRHFEHTFLLYSEMGVSLLSVGPHGQKVWYLGFPTSPITVLYDKN